LKEPILEEENNKITSSELRKHDRLFVRYVSSSFEQRWVVKCLILGRKRQRGLFSCHTGVGYLFKLAQDDEKWLSTVYRGNLFVFGMESGKRQTSQGTN